MLSEIKKILFATDLSKNARHAFDYAAGIAYRHGAGGNCISANYIPLITRGKYDFLRVHQE